MDVQDGGPRRHRGIVVGVRGRLALGKEDESEDDITDLAWESKEGQHSNLSNVDSRHGPQC